MKKLNPLEYQTGFLMGFVFGFFLEGLLLIVYNLACGWFGWTRLNVAWWMLIPVPLVCGLVMGKAIAGLHLEDY